MVTTVRVEKMTVATFSVRACRLSAPSGSSLIFFNFLGVELKTRRAAFMRRALVSEYDARPSSRMRARVRSKAAPAVAAAPPLNTTRVAIAAVFDAPAVANAPTPPPA